MLHGKTEADTGVIHVYNNYTQVCSVYMRRFLVVSTSVSAAVLVVLFDVQSCSTCAVFGQLNAVHKLYYKNATERCSNWH